MLPKKSVNAQKRHKVSNPHSLIFFWKLVLLTIPSLTFLSIHPITQVSFAKNKIK